MSWQEKLFVTTLILCEDIDWLYRKLKGYISRFWTGLGELWIFVMQFILVLPWSAHLIGRLLVFMRRFWYWLTKRTPDDLDW